MREKERERGAMGKGKGGDRPVLIQTHVHFTEKGPCSFKRKVGQKWSWVQREEPKSRAHHLSDPHTRLLVRDRCQGAIYNHSPCCSKVDQSHPLPSFVASKVGQKTDF